MRMIGMLLRLVLKWKSYLWYPGFREKKKLDKMNQTTHKKITDVMVIMVDHYEPSRAEGEKGVQRVRDWCEKYKELAMNYTDSDGIHPQHSWFYRREYENFEIINILSEYVYQGFGEIEFHLHHGFDNEASFREKIKTGVEWFNKTGAMITAESKPAYNFAYIAGNWALDNGRNDPQFSGCNTEISVLGDLGCYADFTFPAVGETAQPKKVNAIYYVEDTPEPKSYDTGVDVEVGGSPSGDLMIFQGPLYLDWKNKYLEGAEIENFARYGSHRLQNWRNAHIHVRGKPEWMFIKLHTHGMQSRDTFLSEEFNQLCEDLEKEFMTDNCRLHYVSAREAYNIVKAAENGKKGNAGDFRNFVVKEPANKKVLVNTPYKLICYGPDHIEIEIESPLKDTRVHFKETPIKEIYGDFIKKINFSYVDKIVKNVDVLSDGNYNIIKR